MMDTLWQHCNNITIEEYYGSKHKEWERKREGGGGPGRGREGGRDRKREGGGWGERAGGREEGGMIFVY